ncbi:MAG: exopolyphosphatase [Pyrinomonadaceae bacterium]|nr:exopolyphosphatase [Sphingobacteriaceae bacterium]
MSERIAALDLGTNTFHLLIADVGENRIVHIILEKQDHVKLGEGGINEGRITDAAFQRGLTALSVFQKYISEYQVRQVRAVGTAALRTAHNGAEFMEKVKAETGIVIEIIDGEKEADLIYQGVKQAVDLSQTSLIMDIGGGSVEFIIANTDKIFWKKSYPIGAAKLMASFHHSDPISDYDIKEIHSYLDTVLSDLKTSITKYLPQMLIGSAGAFETFATLCQIKTQGKPSKINRSFLFNAENLHGVLFELIRSTHQDRVNNPAILPVRTDMIVVAALLTKYILQQHNFRSLKMTNYALKEGLVINS